MIQASLDIKQDPFSKTTNIKGVVEWPQVVACMPGKRKALSLT
jgi:hypothetical protein